MKSKSVFFTTIFFLIFGFTGLSLAQSGQSGQTIQNEFAQGSGTALSISPAQVRLVEQALSQRGYDSGNVDGSWDQQTASALTNFQQAIGLEPTGQLNSRSIQALGLRGSQAFGGGAGQYGAQAGSQGQYGGQQQYGAQPYGYGQQMGVQQQPYGYNQQYGTQQPYGYNQQGAQPGFQGQQYYGIQQPGTVGSQAGVGQFYGAGPAWSAQQQGGYGYGAQQGLAYGPGYGQQIRQGAVQGTGVIMGISPSQVRLIEQALNQRGYDAGNVDGSWDVQTTQGLYNFQQAIGLAPTGQINPRTMQALGLGQQGAGSQQFYGISPPYGAGQGTQGLQSQRIYQGQY